MRQPLVAGRNTRPVSCISAARKDFEQFPHGAQAACKTALTIAADGGKAEIAKPLKGLGAGILEIALSYQSNAYRVVYALLLDDVWVLHAFNKKAMQGVKTPKQDVDLVLSRLKRLKAMLL